MEEGRDLNGGPELAAGGWLVVRDRHLARGAGSFAANVERRARVVLGIVASF